MAFFNSSSVLRTAASIGTGRVVSSSCVSMRATAYGDVRTISLMEKRVMPCTRQRTDPSGKRNIFRIEPTVPMR